MAPMESAEMPKKRRKKFSSINYLHTSPRFILEKGRIYNGRTGDLFGHSLRSSNREVMCLKINSTLG